MLIRSMILALALFRLAGQPTDVLYLDIMKPPPADIAARSGFSLPVVYVFWILGGWHVGAVPVSFPYEWDAGRRVFASNSVPSAI